MPSWGRPLVSHTLREENAPLQSKIFYSIEKAEKAAREYSEHGLQAAVLEWFADYDMY